MTAGMTCADVTLWNSSVNTQSPQFLISNATGVTPQIVDVGAYSNGSMTYEFVVNNSPGTWQSLLTQVFVDSNQGIRITNPDRYGITEFGTRDYQFIESTTFGSDVHLAFVSDTVLGGTLLYVNGVYADFLGVNIGIGGLAGLGGQYNNPNPGDFVSDFLGTIYGAAVYGTALSAGDVAENSAIFLMPLALYNSSLAEVAQLSNTATTSVGMTLHGLHGHPMDYRLAPGKDRAVWLGGDWGTDDHGQSDGSLGIAEIAGAYAIGSSDIQVGGAIGKSWSDHDTQLGGNQEVRGQYLLGEIILPIEIAGPTAWMTLTASYHQSDADVLRAYAVGLGTDTSYGETDISTWAFRVRTDWENVFEHSGVKFSPYLDLSYMNARVDGYSEAGGVAPAVYDSLNDHAVEARAGVNMLYEINSKLALTAETGLTQRLIEQNSAVSGVALGSGFYLNSPDSKDTWATGSIGVKADTDVGTINFRLNGTTEGSASSAWVSFLWSLPL